MVTVAQFICSFLIGFVVGSVAGGHWVPQAAFWVLPLYGCRLFLWDYERRVLVGDKT